MLSFPLFSDQISGVKFLKGANCLRRGCPPVEESQYLSEFYVGCVKIKYTCIMSHKTASIAAILKIRLGLDSQDFKLDYDYHKSSLQVFIN